MHGKGIQEVILSTLEEGRVVAGPNGCIIWTGSRQHGGYGQLRVKMKMKRANRVACEEAHGPPPEGKPYALHSCDNPPCVNGYHLRWGSNSDNMQDRRERGRARTANTGKTHCKRGHGFTEENTYVWKSATKTQRSCKTCYKVREKK